jgi:hypothetical protein
MNFKKSRMQKWESRPTKNKITVTFSARSEITRILAVLGNALNGNMP